jgi:hypothetical protein
MVLHHSLWPSRAVMVQRLSPGASRLCNCGGARCTCAQADRRALNITLNSIDTELTRDDRRKLYSSFGELYPVGQVHPSSNDDCQPWSHSQCMLTCERTSAWIPAMCHRQSWQWLKTLPRSDRPWRKFPLITPSFQR